MDGVNRNKRQDMVAHDCNPSCLGGRGRRIGVRGQPGKSMRPYLEKLIAKGLRGVAQSPEFSSQYYQINKLTKTIIALEKSHSVVGEKIAFPFKKL
jgi:hypothetical protein